MKRGKKISDETIKEIIRLRREGYKIKHIVARLNVNKNTVVKYSKKAWENE